MKTELKGWLADNTVTTDNKEDKILVLESAGNLTLSDVLDEMKKEDTGLRAETLKHAVDLFQRTVSELVLNGYSVNTHLQYQWAGGTPQRKYADMLDNLIPQHDAHTTAAWIAFAEALADGVENGFEREAASLVAAFQEISERFDPKVVNTIYQIIHVPDNTLLSNEIIPAAEAAEQGASVQEISDMAADGLFGGGPMPTLKM